MKLKFSEINLSDDDIKKLVKESTLTMIRGYLLNTEIEDAIKRLVNKETEKLIVKALSKNIIKLAKESIEVFQKEGLVFKKDSYGATEKVTIGDYAKKVLDGKYSFQKDGSLEESNYNGKPLMQAVLVDGIVSKISSITNTWIAENEANIRANLATIVTNNIQKSIFGASLPDQKLLAIASPEFKEPEITANQSTAVRAEPIDPDDLPF
jgi:hypothetical protein